jgi:hypothetical protein
MWFMLALVLLVVAGCASKSEDPVQVVNDYLQAIQKGDAKTAWNLVHPDRQTAFNQTTFSETVMNYHSYLAVKELSLQEEESSWRDKLTEKNLPGGHTYLKVAVVKLTWSNGTTQLIHLVHDSKGNWRLMWSPQYALE